MQPELQYGSTASLSVAQNKVLRNTYLLLALTMVPTVDRRVRRHVDRRHHHAASDHGIAA